MSKRNCVDSYTLREACFNNLNSSAYKSTTDNVNGIKSLMPVKYWWNLVMDVIALFFDFVSILTVMNAAIKKH